MFKIGKPVKNTSPKNIYIVCFECMAGDADFYKTTEFETNDSAWVNICIEFYNEYKKLNYDDSHHNIYKNFEHNDYYIELIEGWTIIPWYEQGDCYYTIQNFYIRYFDENGAEYYVEILKDEN